MPLETGTTIEDLDDSWPLSGDVTEQGDNHLRLIKSVLKTQFPGVDGDGFKIPITATEAELNTLTGNTENIKAKFTSLDASISSLTTSLNAPKDTVMVFYNAAPPTGWTLVSSSDRFLRISSSGGSTGGSEGTSFSKSHTHTNASVALTIAQMPAHDHTPMNIGAGNSSGNVYSQGLASTPLSVAKRSYGTTTVQGGGQGHSHTNGNTTISWSPSYANVILAKKS